MISNLRQVLKAAPRSAVGAFNTLGIDMTAAVIGAAEDLDAPVVLGIAIRRYHSVRGDVLAAACRWPIAYSFPRRASIASWTSTPTT